jgi:mRNA-degrading endonuclease RelE of RelBE toxin-antitoxin system
MNLQFTRQAKKDLTVFDRKDRNRIITALYKLQADPHSGDLKKLKGRSDMWRLRVGEIRVIFPSNLMERQVDSDSICHGYRTKERCLPIDRSRGMSSRQGWVKLW